MWSRPWASGAGLPSGDAWLNPFPRQVTPLLLLRSARCTRNSLRPVGGMGTVQIEGDIALLRAELANLGAGTTPERRHADRELPLQSHAHCVDLWDWCACEHLAYQVRLEVLVHSVLHLAWSETKRLEVFRLLQMGSACFGGRGGVSGYSIAMRPGINQAGWRSETLAMPPLSSAQPACQALSALLPIRSVTL